MKDIAIIGAGIAGLACAGELDKEQYNITIFDKGRGKGGRVATRRDDDFHFDHGAQYISEPTKKEFRIQHKDWIKRGIVKEWKGNIGELNGSVYSQTFESESVYVGVPKMSILGNDMAEQINDVKFVQPVRITSIFKKFDEWYLEDEEGIIHGGYKFIVIAIPATQAKELVKDFDYLVNILDDVKLSARWSGLIGLQHKLPLKYDAAFVQEKKNIPALLTTPIRWLARNSSKPQRPGKEAWVVHATKSWSKTHIDKSKEWVAEELADAFSKIVGSDSPPIIYKDAHLWRYGLVEKSLDQHFILDNNRNISLIGDYCMGNNIESAYVSGKMLGQRVNNIRI